MVPVKIKRNIFKKLYKEIQAPEISILLGARQVGKTTLLKQIKTRAHRDGYKVCYFDLESSADLARLSGNDQDIVKTITSSGDVILIDEFHYLKNASKLFKEIYDANNKVKIYASGSSSLEIHRHLKESLAGRYRKTMIFPFSYEENKRTPHKMLNEYLKWGGMPGLVHRETDAEKMALLENIVNTYISKDIKALIKEENIRAFNSMLYYLAQNQGSLTVYANIARDVGLAESTIARYFEIMSQTYVCYIISSYSNNLANELKKSKKNYLFDIGIRNTLLKDFRCANKRPDKGSLYETFVLLYLILLITPHREIKFWRTKKDVEVDFILVQNRQPVPIEVKSNLNSTRIPAGLKSFIRAYPDTKIGFVINETQEDKIQFLDTEIYFLPFEKIDKIEGLLEILD